MGSACHNCFKTKTDMLKCSLCLKVRYCSKECQKIHWPLHKAECGNESRNQTSAPFDETVSSASSPLPHAQQRDYVRISALPASKVALEACHFCSKSQAQIADRLKRCERCRGVSYCSVQCQRSDWPAHKKVCTKPTKKSE